MASSAVASDGLLRQAQDDDRTAAQRSLTLHSLLDHLVEAQTEAHFRTASDALVQAIHDSHDHPEALTLLSEHAAISLGAKYQRALSASFPSSSTSISNPTRGSVHRAEQVLTKVSAIYASYEGVVDLLDGAVKDALRLVNRRALLPYHADLAQAILREIQQATPQSLTRTALLALGLEMEWRSLLAQALDRVVLEQVAQAAGQGHGLSAVDEEEGASQDRADDSFHGQADDFEEQALPQLHAWLRMTLLPTLRSWHVQHLDTLSQQVLYKVHRALGRQRARQLFDIISDFPRSLAALRDLVECGEEVAVRNYVSQRLRLALQARLLHPGASTRDILQFYTHLIRSLRFVDPTGVILSHVIGPIRSYLRARHDTIPVIVASLLGQAGDFTLLRDMMRDPTTNEAGQTESSATVVRPGLSADQSMALFDETINGPALAIASAPTSTMASNALLTGAHGSSIVPLGAGWDQTRGIVRLPDPDEPDWAPRPIDAGPDYRQSRKSDVIAIVISIFHDEQGFIAAIEQRCAEQILQVRGYNMQREYEINENLKKRFGDAALARCDVMLNDIKRSQRIDRRVHRRPQASKEKDQIEARHPWMDAFLSRLHPLILSRQFWPLFNDDGSPIEGQAAGMANPSTAALGGVHSVGAGVGGPAGTSMMFSGRATTIPMTITPAKRKSISSDAVAPTLASTPLTSTASKEVASTTTAEPVPQPMQQALDVYQRRFARTVDGRRVRWLPTRHTVHLTLQWDDGRTTQERLSPLQACVVQLVANSDTATAESGWSVGQVAEQWQVPVAPVMAAFAYWASRGLLRLQGMGRYTKMDTKA